MESPSMENRCHIIAEVTGSSPVSPTTSKSVTKYQLITAKILPSLLLFTVWYLYCPNSIPNWLL